MLLEFFYLLRRGGVPVSITEFLTLLEALKQHLAGFSVEDFYYLSRATLVKDERHFDRFDACFEHYYRGLEAAFGQVFGEIPEDWLRRVAELHLSEAEKRQVEALGGWDKLMETLRQRLAEQQGRHQGGNKWIGTGGRSPSSRVATRAATSGSAPAGARRLATAATTRKGCGSAASPGSGGR